VRLIAGAFTLALLTVPAGAQPVRPGDVMARLDGYLLAYEERLANVVAEETYRQRMEAGPANRRWTVSRTLLSDFALTLTHDTRRWVGYRDTFEMDGRPVRERDERLERLLSDGAVGEAARIAEQNAKFNLGQLLVSRTINVPTFALEMMSPRVRDRFRVRLAGAGTAEERPGWLVDFRERKRPTLVRRPDGRDQASRIVALVDMQTGEVLQTTMTWEHMKGSMTVSYGRAKRIPVPVPIRMAERYVAPNGELVSGDATYANFRQFETSARIIR
jgi:hypothetical protein